MHGGLPERAERDFEFAHQHIRTVAEFPALLHETPDGVPRISGSLADGCGQHCAAVEVRAHAADQIRAAARAEQLSAAEQVRCEFSHAVTRGTSLALGGGVIPTVAEEQEPLFGAERPRSLAVEVGQATAGNHYGVFGRDQP